MTTPSEYRQFAKEALHAADVAPTEEGRQAFLEIARDLTQAACDEESRIASLKHEAHLAKVRQNPTLH